MDRGLEIGGRNALALGLYTGHGETNARTYKSDTAQLRRDEEPGNAPKPLIVPSYNLNKCPFICKELYM